MEYGIRALALATLGRREEGRGLAPGQTGTRPNRGGLGKIVFLTVFARGSWKGKAARKAWEGQSEELMEGPRSGTEGEGIISAKATQFLRGGRFRRWKNAVSRH